MQSFTLSLSPYTPDQYSPALCLLEHADRAHLHVDWQEVGHWLQNPAVVACLGWRAGELVAMMAASPPHEGTSWLRVVALGSGVAIGSTVSKLWAELRERLRQQGVRQVSVLLDNAWLPRALEGLGFDRAYEVVTLQYAASVHRKLPPPKRHDLILRAVQVDDVPAVLAVDHAAFEPIWRMQEPDFYAARAEAASFTLAEYDGAIVGYELTIPHGVGVHLARLAAAPEMQGQGVGSCLLRYVLLHDLTPDVHLMTVNTQSDNLASLHLYRRFGFTMTGDDVPVWEAWLE